MLTPVDKASIVSAIDAGERGSEVAPRFGVTRERIRQVYFEGTGKPLPRQGSWCRTCKIRTPEPDHQNGDAHRAFIRARSEARFWSYVDKTDGCWLWNGLRYPTGYGHVNYPQLTGEHNGYAHRTAFRLVKGPIPEGLELDHLCRNPPCVNPDHLEPVTRLVNMQRSHAARAMQI